MNDEAAKSTSSRRPGAVPSEDHGWIVPQDSELNRVLTRLSQERRAVFFTGLPATGKSLLLQQLALIALSKDRAVHLLQWDVTRQPFETEGVRSRFPSTNDVMHPSVIKAVGLWARKRLGEWDERHPEGFLIGEVPLLGGRLIELTQVIDDRAERLLGNGEAIFVVVVPSANLRELLREARVRTIASPRHEQETQDAPPKIMDYLWNETYRLAIELGLCEESSDGLPPYDPELCASVYCKLIHPRDVEVLEIDTILKPKRPVGALPEVCKQLVATQAEASEVIARAESDGTGG